MGKGMMLFEEDPLGGEGAAGAAHENGGADPLGGEGGAGIGEGEGEGGGDPLGGEPEAAPKVTDTNKALADAVAKLADRLDAKPGQRALTPEEQEAAWQKLEAESGLTRQQLQWQDQQTRRAVLVATLDSNKELGKSKAEKIVGTDDPELLAKVEKAMAALPPEVQANPKAWEDAAYLELGRASRTMKKTPKQDLGTEGGGQQGGQRRIVGGTGTTGQMRGTVGQRQQAKKEYPAFEQHVIDRQFGGNAEAYEKYKNQKSVDTDVKITAGPGAGAADKELERLTQNNT